MDSSNDKIIGELKEFKRMAIQEFTLIRYELKLLNQFRWKVYTTSGVISSLLVILMEVILRGTK